MPVFDLDQSPLQTNLRALDESADFALFWAMPLAEAPTHALRRKQTAVDLGLTLEDVSLREFAGSGRHPTKAWLIRPACDGRRAGQSPLRRAAKLFDLEPYTFVTTYPRVHRNHGGAVLRTLCCLDGESFAERSSAPALFLLALMDPISAPSKVCAAYNHDGARAGEITEAIDVYESNQNDGGSGHQFLRQLRWLGASSTCAGTANPTDAGER